MPAKDEDYMDEDVHSIQTSQTSGKPLNYDEDEKVWIPSRTLLDGWKGQYLLFGISSY